MAGTQNLQVENSHQSAGPGTGGPDTADANAEPVTITGGENPVSFDELESLHESQKQKAPEAREPKNTENVEKTTENQDTNKPKQTQDKQDSGEQNLDSKKTKDKEDKEDTEDTEEAKEAQDEQTENESSEESEQKEVKNIKLKVDEKDMDLPGNAELEVKVDGQPETVSLQELRDSYSGHKAVGRRFNQLRDEKEAFQKEKSEFEQSQNTVNQQLNQLVETMQQDPVEAIRMAGNISGANGDKLVDDFYQKITDEFQKLSEMSEEERAAYKTQVEADRAKERLKSYEQKEAELQRQQEVAARAQDLQEKYNIDSQTFDSVAQDLVAMYKNGELDQPVSVEFVVDVVLNERYIDNAKQALSSVDESLSEREDLINELLNIQKQNQEFTVTDLKDIVAESFGQETKAKTLSQKVLDRPDSDEAKAPTKAKSPQNEDVWSFDQL